jgi:hypothetical protein
VNPPNTAEGNSEWVRRNIEAAGLAEEIEMEALPIAAFRYPLEETCRVHGTSY